MKNLIITSASVVILSASLIGCGAWNTVDSVGTGLVNTGAGVVTTTGAVVGGTVNAGVDVLVGRPVTSYDMTMYRKHGFVYHNGHAYKVHQGKYVIVR